MDQSPNAAPVYVGIDVAKDRLDVHVLPSGEAFALPRDSDRVAVLIERLSRLAPRLIVLEATGGFEAIGDCRNFRVWGRTMLLKEPWYAATQTALDPG